MAGVWREHMRLACRDFAATWAVCSGVRALPLASAAARAIACAFLRAHVGKKSPSADLRAIFVALKNNLMAAPSTRTALFVSFFWALFRLCEAYLRSVLGRAATPLAAVAAVCVALPLENNSCVRWTLGQYAAVRAAAQLLRTLSPVSLPHGDVLLFALASGQAVYGYVVCPETLDRAYVAFLTRVTQMHPLTIALVRDCLSDKCQVCTCYLKSSDSSEKPALTQNTITFSCNPENTADPDAMPVNAGMSTSDISLRNCMPVQQDVLESYMSPPDSTHPATGTNKDKGQKELAALDIPHAPYDSPNLESAASDPRCMLLKRLAQLLVETESCQSAKAAAVVAAVTGTPGHMVTCAAIHPGQSCVLRVLSLFPANVRATLGMYAVLHALSAMPAVIGGTPDARRRLLDSARGAMRSATFMSTYVVLFQIMLCMQRRAVSAAQPGGALHGRVPPSERGWTWSYWAMGFVSAASVFVERASRRPELALYVLPRAAVSVWRMLRLAGSVRDVRGGEYVLLSAGAAVLLTLHRSGHAGSGLGARVLSFFAPLRC